MSDLARRAYSVQELASIWGRPVEHVDDLVMSGRMRAFCLGRTPKMLRVTVAEAARVREILDAQDVPPQVAGPFVFERPKRKPRKPRGPVPTVYFIDCGAYTKIGFTTQFISRRVDGMRTANPFPMKLWAELPAAIQVETELHKIFAKQRHRREWFKLGKGAREKAIEEIKRRGGKVYKRPKNV